MAQDKKIGDDCKAYHNTGTYPVPVWNEVTNIEDLSLPLSKTLAEFKTRGSKWILKRSGKIDSGIEFKYIYDKADDDWSVLRDGFLNNTPIEFAIMDEAIATSGAQGLRATCEVVEMPMDQPLEDGVSIAMSIAPAPADNEPEWYTVA